MSVYRFKKPLMTNSTQQIEVYDDNKRKVGFIQRSYQKKIYKMVEYFMTDPLFVNLFAVDQENNRVIEINEKVGKGVLFQSQWHCQSEGLGAFTLFDRTKIRTNPRYDFQTEVNGMYVMKKDIGDRKVYIENAGSVIAEVGYEKVSSVRNIIINIKSPRIHCLEAASLYYLVDLRK